MKKHVWWLLMFLCLWMPAGAADNLRIADIRSTGMGGNEAISSPLFNPSLIAMLPRSSVSLNYFNRYALKELGTCNGSLYFSHDVLSAGVDFSSFGYDAYRENQIRLVMGKRLGRQWTLGIGIQYAFLQTDLYEEKIGRLSTDVGLTFAPVDNVLIGVLIMNLPSVRFGDKDVELNDFESYLVQIGFNWEFINGLFISCALGSNEEHAIGGSAGIEYQPFDNFSVRAGVKGSPLLPSFGIGYGFAAFTVDAAVVYHPVLGVSSGVGVKLSF